MYTTVNLCRDHAREVLSAIEHPEMRKAIDELQRQIKEGVEEPRFCWLDPSLYSKAGYALREVDYSKALIFTPEAFCGGLLWSFFHLFENAYPEYHPHLEGKFMVLSRTEPAYSGSLKWQTEG